MENENVDENVTTSIVITKDTLKSLAEFGDYCDVYTGKALSRDIHIRVLLKCYGEKEVNKLLDKQKDIFSLDKKEVN